MALNLGPTAFDAITNLKNNPDWRRFVEAMREQMSNYMNKAVEVDSSDRQDATGYARGLRDIVVHIEMVENPLPGNRVPKPSVRPQHG